MSGGEVERAGPPTPRADVLAAATNPKDAAGAAKAQMWLVPPVAAVFEARVMESGARKYGAYNWRSRPVRMTVYLSAAMRHLAALLDGQDADPESGQRHAAHVRSCMGILLDALATGNLIDDRPPAGAAGRVLAEPVAGGV